MKIGLSIKPFNSIMRFRRQELGITQAELARQARVTIEFVGRIETLKMPIAGKIQGESYKAKRSKLKRFRLIREKLNRIAQVLELSFDYLFPQDYLEAIEQELLPWYSKPIIWVKEVNILELSASTPELLLPSPEEMVIDDASLGLSDSMSEVLSELSYPEIETIKLRFGFDGEVKTLQEVGDEFGVSPARIRQIEAKALRKLRHPIRSRKLRDYLR